MINADITPDERPQPHVPAEEQPETGTRYRQLVEQMAALVFELTPSGETLFANPAVAAITGYPVEELIGKNFWDIFIAPEQRPRLAEFYSLIRSRNVRSFALVLRGRLGEALQFELSTANDYNDQGRLQQIVAIGVQVGGRRIEAQLFANLNALQVAEEELRLQNDALVQAQEASIHERAQYEQLFQFAPDGYLVTDAVGLIQEANVAIATLLGVKQTYLVGKPLLVFFSEKDHGIIHATLAHLNQAPKQNRILCQSWETELCPRQAAPVSVAVTLSCSRPNGTIAYLRWLIRDITQQKQAEAKIHRQAFYDALTGLPNRAMLDTYLPKMIAQAQRNEDQLAVAFLDLDQFKAINDTLGHAVGDELLKQVGQRLQSCLRESDLLVRWGGDEFIMVLTTIATLEDVTRTCDRMIASLQPGFTIRQHQLHISTSFGVALFPEAGENPETLLRHADQALYQAKNQGRNTYRFYGLAD